VKWVPDFVPGTVEGDTTIVGTRFAAPPSSSSQVRKTAVALERYWRLAKIFGSHLESQASPVPTLQSCMSLQLFGVMNVNRADTSALAPSGVACFAHWVRTFVK
jgi:hypothetical protein